MRLCTPVLWVTGSALSLGVAVRSRAAQPIEPPTVRHSSAPAYVYADYAPYGQHRRGIHRFGQWLTIPMGKEATLVFWGEPDKWAEASGEEHAVIVSPRDGRRWIWVRAYIDQKAKRRYAIITERAELEYAGRTEDVTPPPGFEGQPYALAEFDGTFTVRAWGTIAQDPKVCAARMAAGTGGAQEDGCEPATRRKWFWQHTITPVVDVRNPCWHSGTSGSRMALRQDEVWWDSNRGWARGRGSLDSFGIPDGMSVIYEGMQTIAKGIGFAWTGAHGNCLSGAWEIIEGTVQRALQ